MANRDIGWNYCTMVGADKKRTKCNYCNKVIFGGGVTRMKEHLAAVAGDVSQCPSVPKEVRILVWEHLIKKKNERNKEKIEKQRVQEELMSMPEQQNSDTESDENEEDREIQRAFRASKETYVNDERRREGLGSSGIKRGDRSKSLRVDDDFDTRAAGRIDSYVQKRGGGSQPSIKTAIKGIKDAKKHIGRAISNFFYFNHIPHNAANSPYYETMVDAIAQAGPGIKPPTAHELSNTYLDVECAEIKQLIDSYSNYWDEYGCTLMCDGWSTQNRRKIINFLVYSTQGTVFLKSIDATDKFQNPEYICHLMDNMVNVIGEDRIVQIVTDNGANYKAAGQLLMEKRRQLYWTPCVAHCIDLILEDISKEIEVKTIISNCQSLTGFIYNHGWLLSIMRKETKGKELIRPAVTRFATHFIALESIYMHKEDLRRMIASRDWSAKVPKLGPKDKQTATLVYTLIHSDTFWTNIASIILVFEPLVKVLRMVDNDDKAEMGYLYEAMDRAKESIKKNVGARKCQKWWNIIDKRWERQLHRPIHAAGYFLSPHIQYSNSVTNDDEVLNGWTSVLERMVPGISTQIEISKEVEQYRMKAGVFNSTKKKL